MFSIFTVTRLGVLLFAAVGIGVIAILCAGRRSRRGALVVLGLLGLLFVGYYFTRHTVSYDQPSAVISLGPNSALIQPETGFEPSAEQLRHARVFPSIGQAAVQLTARIADSLANLPEGRGEPPHLVLTVPPAIRPGVVATLRSAFPLARQSFDPGPATRPANANEVWLRIEVIPDPHLTSRSDAIPRRGTLKAFASGMAGTLDDSVTFVDKAWAGDAASMIGIRPLGSTVCRSTSPCTTAAEALAQAHDAAMAHLERMIDERLAGTGRFEVAADEPWFRDRLRAAATSPQFIQDEFVQELALPYGSVFQASVLVSPSPGSVESLCGQLIAGRQQRTTRTMNTAGAVAALSLLILLVYLFLNTVTRGYFTLRLRLAAVGLLAAAVLLIMMVS